MKKAFFLVIALILLAGLIPFAGVDALTIIPPRIEYDVDPGDEIVDTLRVFNETKEKLTIYSEVKSFSALDEKGTPEFYEPKEGEMANWIDVTPDKVSLLPGEEKEIVFSISVPQNANPGGYFAGILWSGQGPEVQEKNVPVAVVPKTGHLVLIRVLGDIEENGRILEFDTKDSQKIFNHLPIDFVARFENLGNVHLMPLGQVEIKNIFGQQKAIIDINSLSGNILPKSVRKLENSWVNIDPVRGGFFTGLNNEWDNFGLGRYTADLALVFGEKNETLRAYTSFWILPWRTFSLGLLALVLLIVLVKFYNRIITKTSGKISK